ncbi:hypothetical protein KIH41_16990 [Litoribacter ruber]|uniref:hypothetical protein n=1 Tax=Litoribacter ruber TaxID=702568 RepID=UPI001BD969F7|nr:hypothetical protein [Litoribacter ruber]MBT0812986.1 hypothetical protein [Litoribacter ruber]
MKHIKKLFDGILWLLVGDRGLECGMLSKGKPNCTYVPDPKPKPYTREQQEAILLCKAIGVILREEGMKNQLDVRVEVRPLGKEPPGTK